MHALRHRFGTAVLLLLLGGCASRGPLAIDPDRPFAGLRDIVADIPSGGTLNVILVHGMRADAPQTFDALREALRPRLHLGALESTQHWSLVETPPTATLNGVPLFDGVPWETVQPQLSVDRYSATDGTKVVHVNFYIFEYWQALAYIKCRFVVAPDASVIGETTRSDYCRTAPWSAHPSAMLSGRPEFGNRWIKSEILEWGLSDAVIVTSSYRAVLHQAVGEALDIATRGAAAEAPAAAPGVSASSVVPADARHRFAFVTESLGSYVISDALTALHASAAAAAASPQAVTEAVHRRAAELAVCGATQIHMLANQVTLLRLSEISVATTASPASAGNAAPGLAPARAPETGAHFFAGCPGGESQTDPTRRGVQFGARQIVAYHEPNDLLTYYTSDTPGSTGAANPDTTNVVKPYATVWVPFLLANPEQAHTGQAGVAAMMDLLACGHSANGGGHCP